MTTSDIRDLRESKGLSQTAAAEICGLTFSKYERIEIGSPKTTDAEIAAVKKALRATKKTGKKLYGRPFADPKLQAAVEAARAEGKSVAAVLAAAAPASNGTAEPAKEEAPAPEPEPAKEEAPAPEPEPAKKAPAKKAATPRKPRAKKSAETKAAEELI
jgi:transcriptional regulator with XRE-family HTH domain